MARGYWPTDHFEDRLRERRISLADVTHAILNASGCERYDGDAEQGGTCWRITGPTLDEDEPSASIGLEAFLTTSRTKKITLVTVF